MKPHQYKTIFLHVRCEISCCVYQIWSFVKYWYQHHSPDFCQSGSNLISVCESHHLSQSTSIHLCDVRCSRQVSYCIQSNRNVSRQHSDHQTKQTIWWSLLNTSLLAIIRCLCFSPPSNQLSWLSADVIIINLFRRACDDWWEPHPNQWRMHDKCLLWRLWQRHLRWRGFSPHYTTNTAPANASPTLRPDL